MAELGRDSELAHPSSYIGSELLDNRSSGWAGSSQELKSRGHLGVPLSLARQRPSLQPPRKRKQKKREAVGTSLPLWLALGGESSSRDKANV